MVKELVQLLGQTTPAAPDNFWSSVIPQSVAAIVGAIVGGIVTLGISWKLQAKRRISYSIEISRSIPPVSEKIQDKVGITFNNQPVKNLWFVNCSFVNTGNLAVERQSIRILFLENNQILDAFFEPKPILENGVQSTSEFITNPHYERAFKFDQLDVGQAIHFGIFLTGEAVYIPKVISKGQGDVRVIPGKLSKELDDDTRFKVFISSIVLFNIFSFLENAIPLSFPPSPNNLFSMPLTEIVFGLHCGLIATMIGSIPAFARVISRTLRRLGKNSENQNINVSGDANVIHVQK